MAITWTKACGCQVRETLRTITMADLTGSTTETIHWCPEHEHESPAARQLKREEAWAEYMKRHDNP